MASTSADAAVGASTSTSHVPSLVAVLADSSFSDQVVDVATFLSRSKPEQERSGFTESWLAKASSEDVSKDAVTEELFAEVKGLGEGLEREIEGAHNLISALVLDVSDAEKAQTLASKHAQIVAADSGRETVKYRILSNIFNSLPPSAPTREAVFLALVDVASSNDELDLLSPALAALPHWLAQWNIPESRKAAVLEQVASKLEPAHPTKAYEFRVAHLQYLSINSAARADASIAQQSAEKAVAAALKLPKVFEFDTLLKLSVTESLQSSSPAIFQLLKVLVQGSLADYQQWASSNSAELSRLGVDAEAVEKKVRLLEIAVLCSKAVEAASPTGGNGTEVPYSAISEAIQVDVSEVESWVIDVIRAGLVSGKLSQVTLAFRVYRSTYRSFGQEQWTLLEKRLSEWDKTLETILSTLANPRTGGPQLSGIPGADAALSSTQQAAASTA
ncbi:unnamed protein product [Parajaminaea phylloscopi]